MSQFQTVYENSESFGGKMQFISDISIPRRFGFEKQLGHRIELSMFCNASSEAYGAVAYVNYFSECPKNIFLVFYYQNPVSLLSKKNI